MKPPVSVPPEREHDDETKRPPGTAVKRHVVPTKFEPEAVTVVVPGGPEVGLNFSVGGEGTVNVAPPASPLVPVT